MANPVICVENLSKKYLLRHQTPEPYTTLRDAIASGARSLSRRLLQPRTPQPHQEEFWALKAVSFEVKQGDRIGIIGRNGAGKSTLLKILSRITAPTSGQVRLRGRVASLLEVGTGFHPELTGRENIYLNGAILGMSKAEIRRRFDEIVAFAEVETFLDTPVKRYSSGMYVRLAFAIAAHLEPEVLIVDEVLAVGDAQFQKKCLGKMEEVGQSGRTVLFVSHNMATVKRLCTSGIHLKAGTIDCIGSIDSAIETYFAHGETLQASPANCTRILWSDSDLDVVDFYACDRQGNRKTRFTTTETVCFLIKYDLKCSVPNLRVGLDFYSYLTGDMLFRSFDDDVQLRSREPGYVKSLCVIPSHLLKSGKYFASLQIGIHNIRWIVNDAILEQVWVESIDGVNRYYADTRPGVIMPELSWNNVVQEITSSVQAVDLW